MTRRREEKAPLPPGYVLKKGSKLAVGDVVIFDYQPERILNKHLQADGYYFAMLEPQESDPTPRPKHYSSQKLFCTKIRR